MNPNIIHYHTCPVCNSTSISKLMLVEDHSVTKEAFEIWQCASCKLRFTQDVPDESSIGRYYKSPDYISHSNTRAGLINKMYHLVRNFTIGQKKRLVSKYTGLNKGSLLDIGAGTGLFASFMKNNGWAVTGLEPDPETRRVAFDTNHIDLKPAESLFGLTPQSFNAITMWHVLEHVHDLHGYLDQICKLLKPGAVLIIAVPNYTSADAARYREYWAAYDVPIHLYHFAPSSMKKLLALHGLKIKTIKPMWFDSFYVSLLSTKYKTGKQQLLNGFAAGLMSNLSALSDKTKCSSLIYVAEVL